MNYKVVYRVRRQKARETEPVSLTAAEVFAAKVAPECVVVTILKENDGSDHPANKGKYFLHQIVK